MFPRQIARRRRLRFERDDRPRWDDPDLPVYTKAGEPKPAHMLSEFCQHQLIIKHPALFPSWRDDKTYFMRKGERKPVRQKKTVAKKQTTTTAKKTTAKRAKMKKVSIR